MIDVGAEIAHVSRALNKVKRNGEAVVAANAALEHGKQLALDAGKLPDLFRGMASGSNIRKRITNATENVKREVQEFNAPSLAGAAVQPSRWPTLRRLIEKVYIDGSEVYAAQEVDPKIFAALVGDLDAKILRYASKLEEAGLSAPGLIIGDALAAVGGIGGKIAVGAGEGVKDLGKGVTSIVGGLFSGLWPVLIVAGVGAALYFAAPMLLAGAARKAII